jgi:drug/metabolite transporter (DMT)-like permease
MSETASNNVAGNDASSQANANLRAMGLITIGMCAFVVNDTLMKKSSTELPLGQIMALRGLLCCIFMLPIVAMTSGLTSILKVYSWPLFFRNVAEIGAVFTFLAALFRLPMASVSGVLQAVPLVITAAAAFFLREPVGWRRWTASAVGLAGVLLIIRPGTSGFSIWSLAALATVFFVTARDLATRFIPNTAPSITITFVTAVVVTLAGAALGLMENWLVPSATVVAQLSGAAALALIGYWSMIEAMRTAEVSAIAPFRYSVVLWAMIMGFLAFNEIPSVWTLIGSAIVISAGLYTWHRERILARQRRAGDFGQSTPG